MKTLIGNNIIVELQTILVRTYRDTRLMVIWFAVDALHLILPKKLKKKLGAAGFDIGEVCHGGNGGSEDSVYAYKEEMDLKNNGVSIPMAVFTK